MPGNVINRFPRMMKGMAIQSWPRQDMQILFMCTQQGTKRVVPQIIQRIKLFTVYAPGKFNLFFKLFNFILLLMKLAIKYFNPICLRPLLLRISTSLCLFTNLSGNATWNIFSALSAAEIVCGAIVVNFLLPFEYKTLCVAQMNAWVVC